MDDWAGPGVVHTDLLNLNKIPDPFYEKNELDLQWIGETNWVYKKSFKYKLNNNSKEVLVCEGIDTIAEIYLNSQFIGKAENMFRRYEFDITSFLKDGLNEIEIKFISPVKYADQEKAKYSYVIPDSSDLPVTIKNRNLIRKSPCHGGWDWGPCFMTMGIWKDIYIASYDDFRIEYVTTAQVHKNNSVDLLINLFIDSEIEDKIEITTDICEHTNVICEKIEKGKNKITYKINVKNPDLWMPVGYGIPFLYELNIQLKTNNRVEKYNTKIGFREVKLVKEKDQLGESFYYKINDIHVFAKGANWIPIDSFSSRMNKDRYENLLKSSLDANLNLIRVWGGGIYESEEFYNFCDENGLMVWQDFTFACALYPASDEFLDNVKKEAVHQIRRLANHPSLIMWCGNNENEMAMEWYSESRENVRRYIADYDKLYVQTLYKVVKEEKSDVPYWSGSPSNGIGEYGNANDQNRGDIHYWDVWHGGKSFREYLKINPRFCSEFGFQSFPSLETLSSCMGEEHFNITSPVMEHHQKNWSGNSKILEYMSREYRMSLNFEYFVYLSQLQQALAIKAGSEHWRRIKPRCMGIVYWQLNDIWPVVAWSSIEYGGRWKMLHYMAKKFFAPVLISSFEEDNKLRVFITSDRGEVIKSEAKITSCNFSGNILNTIKCKYIVNKYESKEIAGIDLSQLIPKKYKREEIFVVLETEVDGENLKNHYFFTPLKQCELPKTQLKTKIKFLKNKIKINIKAESCAFYVWLNFGKTIGVFSDNVFNMLPGEEKEIEFQPFDEKTNLNEIADTFTLKTLRDTY